MSDEDFDVAAYEKPRGKTCAGCRKHSDGAITYTWTDGVTKMSISLCGTHFDEFLREEPKALHGRERLTPEEATAQFERVGAFAKRLREGKYKACWDAVLP